MTIRIGAATTDDLPDIVASVDALFATDAGAHNAAATNLRWASESGIAYDTSLLASDGNLVLLARDGNEVAGHLVGRLEGPGSVHPTAQIPKLIVRVRFRDLFLDVHGPRQGSS